MEQSVQHQRRRGGFGLASARVRTQLPQLGDDHFVLTPPAAVMHLFRALFWSLTLALVAWMVRTAVVDGATPGPWHLLICGFLGLISFGLARPASFDPPASFASDRLGLHFVTSADGSATLFVPWEDVGAITSGSVMSASRSIQGLLFELRLCDPEARRQLRGTRSAGSVDGGDSDGWTQVAISASARRPGKVRAAIEALRPAGRPASGAS